MRTIEESEFTPNVGLLESESPKTGSSHRRRLTINISPSERAGRIAFGAIGAVTGILLLVTTSGVLAIVLEVLLIGAGVDMMVTGALGHCPLYAKLGHVPKSLRSSS